MTDVIKNETIRTLLLPLTFDGDGPEPDLGNVRAAISEALGMEVDLGDDFLDFDIIEVYPGDVVHADAVPDIFDLDIPAALSLVIRHAAQAATALEDENEGSLKRHVAEILDTATRIARFVGAM